MNQHPHIVPVVANLGDLSLGAVGLGVYWGHLPEAAALLTVLWYLGRFAAVLWKGAVFVKRLLQGDRSL